MMLLRCPYCGGVGALRRCHLCGLRACGKCLEWHICTNVKHVPDIRRVTLVKRAQLVEQDPHRVDHADLESGVGVEKRDG